MSERSISQIIADLKATCAPGSDVALVCEHAQELQYSLNLANFNAAAAMRVANERQDELKLAKEALRFAVTNGLLADGGEWLTDTLEEPPAHLRGTIDSVMGEKR